VKSTVTKKLLFTIHSKEVSEMKRLIRLSSPILLAMLFLGGSALAGKRLDVMVMSNGYPSGPHYNLNIHGKDTATFSCDITDAGSSVFISEYGTSTIEYVSNNRASITELTVLDACAEAFDDDPVRVQLPYEREGYYVFARLRGKPQNSHQTPGHPSSIILTPNPVLKVCDDPGNPDFPSYTECDGSLWTLGLVTTEGVYKTESTGFYRFDGTNESKGKGKGKGNGKATEITGLFQWSGYVCDASLDTSGPEGVPDGVIDEYDVPDTYDTDENGITQDELNAWLADQAAAGFCTSYVNAYIWDIADLVIQSQEVVNDGAKLLKIRWYPVKTTDFN
jgi:hypothetical protein